MTLNEVAVLLECVPRLLAKRVSCSELFVHEPQSLRKKVSTGWEHLRNILAVGCQSRLSRLDNVVNVPK